MLGLVLLFILLSPGLLLTIPPGFGGVFMSGETSFAAVAVHSLIFTAIVYNRAKIPILRDVLNAVDSVY